MSAPQNPRELLELYLQGDLDDEGCDAVERWLAGGPDRSRELRAAERAVAGLDEALMRPEGSDAFAERVKSAARNVFVDSVPVRRKIPRRVWIATFVASAAAVLFLVLRLDPPTEPGGTGRLSGWAASASPGTKWSAVAENRIRLDSGELRILSTASPVRPLVVLTPFGELKAEGTRFIVGTHVPKTSGDAMSSSSSSSSRSSSSSSSSSSSRSSKASITRLLVLSGAVTLANLHGSVEAHANEWAVSTADDPPLKFASQSQTGLGLDLYRLLAAGNPAENLALSPTSITQALALLAEGASAAALGELAQALHLPAASGPSTAEGAQFLAELIRLRTGLADLNSHLESSGHSFDVANSLWVDQSVHLAAAFERAIAIGWPTPIQSADFKSRPEAERERINTWIGQITKGLIPEFFPASSVDGMTEVVLANALYFQANWAQPFASGAGDRDFTRRDGSTVKVPMMYQDTEYTTRRDGGLYSTPLRFPYGSFDAAGQMIDSLGSVPAGGVQVLSYPYEGGRLSMDFLLPASGESFADLEGSLSDEWLAARLSQLVEQPVRILLPKFEAASRIDLKRALGELGVNAIFGAGGIENLVEGPRGKALFVSGAEHQAVVKVDELGTEAAAATAIRMRALSEAANFFATRPFLYLIRDRETGAILFVGRVMDPSVR